jgi:D-3-phosphoglycerate dehydrogenase / 2-oxoglutarate reductase
VATRVLVTDHVFGSLEPERSVLEPLGVELALAPSQDERELADLAHQAAGMLVCYAQVPESVVQAAADGGCRVIARYGIGYDNVDVGAATRAGIVVTNVPDYCLDEVADHTMALLLAVARGVFQAALGVREGRWELPQESVHRLRGRRLALLGMGGIGRRVAARADAFGLEVVGYDPYLERWDFDSVARAETIEDAVAEADFVSLHVPLTPENHHLIDDGMLWAMTRSPVLLNTARGGLVDLEAVTRALDDGRLGAAALDVVEDEPLPEDHSLRRHPRALVTPHAAFYSVEAQEELQRRAAQEVARALNGEPPDRPVNPEVLNGGGGAGA